MQTTIDDKIVKFVGKEITIGGELLRVKFSFSYNDNIDYLCMQVLEQLPFFRARHIIAMNDKFIIRASSDPEIQDYNMYVRGLQEQNDNRVAKMLFPTPDSKNRIITAFCDLVKKVNDMAESVEHSGDNYKITVGTPESMIQVRFEVNAKDNVLRFNILNMDESLRVQDRDHALWNNGNNTFALRSSNVPDINNSIFYICGTNKPKDHEVVTKAFDNTEYRNRTLTAAMNLIAIVNSRQITVKDEDAPVGKKAVV